MLTFVIDFLTDSFFADGLLTDRLREILDTGGLYVGYSNGFNRQSSYLGIGCRNCRAIGRAPGAGRLLALDLGSLRLHGGQLGSLHLHGGHLVMT